MPHKDEAKRRAYNAAYKAAHRDAYRGYRKAYKRRKPWYAFYKSCRQRCEDTSHRSYPRYGGRGIRCLVTITDVEIIWIRDKAHGLLRPSIDRIDPAGHYEFDNIRFIELAENCARARGDANEWGD